MCLCVCVRALKQICFLAFFSSFSSIRSKLIYAIQDEHVSLWNVVNSNVRKKNNNDDKKEYSRTIRLHVHAHSVVNRAHFKQIKSVKSKAMKKYRKRQVKQMRCECVSIQHIILYCRKPRRNVRGKKKKTHFRSDSKS